MVEDTVWHPSSLSYVEGFGDIGGLNYIPPWSEKDERINTMIFITPHTHGIQVLMRKKPALYTAANLIHQKKRQISIITLSLFFRRTYISPTILPPITASTPPTTITLTNHPAPYHQSPNQLLPGFFLGGDRDDDDDNDAALLSPSIPPLLPLLL